MPSLDRDGDVFILNLGDGENRFNPDWVSSLCSALDEVAQAESPKALVLTADGKIWSNGLDLEWIAANVDQVNDFLVDVHGLFARLLSFPAPTIAAIQGHCFAAGAMLALAADQRVMRADRGYFCLPEADIRIPFTPGMNDLIMARLPQPTAHEAMVSARRYGGEQALVAGIVDQTATEDEVLVAATARAQEQAAKDGATLSTIKERMYASTLASLRDPDANKLSGVGG
ncbi:MAG: enoyl-CoA hydratase-related protein [Solirubrobacterales bacterium]